MVRPSDGVGEDGRSWVEAELAPGDTFEEHLLVRNLSADAVTFHLTAADGYFTDNGRFTMLTADRPSVDAGTWIQIPAEIEGGTRGRCDRSVHRHRAGQRLTRRPPRRCRGLHPRGRG